MDSIVKVRRSFMNEIRGFCNMFAQMCDGCCKRPCNCFMEPFIRRAKNLIIVIDRLRNAEEERFYQENPTEEMMDKILISMRQAGKPVMAREIVISGTNRKRKSKALNKLLKRGRIELTIVNGTRFYAVCDDGFEKKQEQAKGDRQ